jgi:hypothetical protein
VSNADAFCQFTTPRGSTENNERGKKDPAVKFGNNIIPVELKVYGRKSMTLDGRRLTPGWKPVITNPGRAEEELLSTIVRFDFEWFLTEKARKGSNFRL